MISPAPETILLDIPSYEGKYAAGDDGHVYALKTYMNPSGEPRQLQDCYNPETGYAHVNLYDFNGKHKVVIVHNLIAKLFLPPKPRRRYTVNHKDLNKRNNNPDNLEWMTTKQNTHHFLNLNPEFGRGEKHPTHKLTEAGVREIRAEQGTTTRRILAARHGVARLTISNVWGRQSWRHVK